MICGAAGVGLNAVNLSIFDQMLVLAVIPAKAGIQGFQAFFDPGFRRGDSVFGIGSGHGMYLIIWH